MFTLRFVCMYVGVKFALEIVNMCVRPNTLKSTFTLNVRTWPIYEKPFIVQNDMKELFQNIEMKSVLSFLKAMNIYGKILKKF